MMCDTVCLIFSVKDCNVLSVFPTDHGKGQGTS